MTVYVDPARPGNDMLCCHMLADTRAELDAMADKIGINRAWLQKPGTPHEHYDLSRRKRAMAVSHGAVEVTFRGIAAIIQRKRKEHAA
jgi:hypothetical protein